MTEFEQDFTNSFEPQLGPDLLDRAPAVEGIVAPAVAGEPFKMRCPNCRKLYSVEASSLTSSGEFSKFECVGCQTTFYAMKPHGAQVLQTSLLETQFAPIYYQALDASLDAGFEASLSGAMPSSLPTIDGFSEGETDSGLERSVRSTVVAAPVIATTTVLQTEFQARIASDLELAENMELVLMWQSILDDYQAEAKHDAFVLRCLDDGQLAYASHKYAQILVASPFDEIARKMRGRVIGLASYGFDATSNGLRESNWSFPLPSFNSLIILMGSILMVVGFGFPHMRQTAGLGFAMIALAIGLRFFLRRPRT